jgi:hypothetical protein
MQENNFLFDYLSSKHVGLMCSSGRVQWQQQQQCTVYGMVKYCQEIAIFFKTKLSG